MGGSGASGGVSSPVDEAEREKLKEKQRQEREKVYLHISINNALCIIIITTCLYIPLFPVGF